MGQSIKRLGANLSTVEHDHFPTLGGHHYPHLHISNCLNSLIIPYLLLITILPQSSHWPLLLPHEPFITDSPNLRWIK